MIDVIYVSIPIEVEYNVSESVCKEKRAECVRRGWLYAYEGYCNSPLNNKNINNHCPWFFPSLGFHINHCVKCMIDVLGLMRV